MGKNAKFSKKNNRSLKRTSGGARRSPTNPPQLTISISGGHVFRFQSSSLSASPVTNLDILGLLAVATSATGTTSIFAAARVRKVTIWAPTATTSQVELDVIWKGDNYIKPVRKSDVAIDTTKPGHVVSTPPKGADAGMWFSFAAGTQTLFTINGPTSVTVDVHVDYVLANAQTLGAIATYTSSGLTAGWLYFGCLDKNTGAPKLIPSGVTYYG